MYRYSEFVEKFEFVKCTKSWKLNGKLCTNVLTIRIFVEKFEIVEWRKSCKLNGKSKNVPNCWAAHAALRTSV